MLSGCRATVFSNAPDGVCVLLKTAIGDADIYERRDVLGVGLKNLSIDPCRILKLGGIDRGLCLLQLRPRTGFYGSLLFLRGGRLLSRLQAPGALVAPGLFPADRVFCRQERGL